MPRLALDLVGRRFERLTVVSFFTKSKSGSAQYNCQCDCGKTTIKLGHNLVTGNTKSCGCLRKESVKTKFRGKRVDSQDYTFNVVYAHHRSSAKKRNLIPCDKNLYYKLIKKPCVSCGSLPKLTNLGKNSYIASMNAQNCPIDEHFAESKVFYCNGVDRIDSNKGYVDGNVQPMCEFCNRAKLDFSQSEFDAWLDRIVAHRSKLST